MAGIAWEQLAGVILFLCAVWGAGRFLRLLHLPSILGEICMGVLLGPNVLDLVPYASNGKCPPLELAGRRLADDAANATAGGSGSGSASGSGYGCMGIHVWNHLHIMDIWSFAGAIGVTLLIMESGMHMNFEKVRAIGARATVVAVLGTFMPLVSGMFLIELFFPGMLYPHGFAAGCALAPTSVGIKVKLLDDAKMLNTLAGQTTLTAAFIDDVFSLVLLMLLTALAAGNASPPVLVGRTIACFALLALGCVLGGWKHAFPRWVPKLLRRFSTSTAASLQPRDEVHLVFMLLNLIFFGYIGSIVGSHLIGAFVAGMAFTNVPRSMAVWTSQMKRILKWLVRIFFAATIGFAVPIKMMLNGPAFLQGLAMGFIPGLLGKVLSGIPARLPYKSKEEKDLMAKASWATFGGRMQAQQYMVGNSMVARGEFAFLVAYSARRMTRPDGTSMMSEEVYAAVIWGLVWCLVSAPFLFKWALAMFVRANPVQRAESIGGMKLAGQDFIVRVIGPRKKGMLHDILRTLHSEGLDVVEASAIVQPEKAAPSAAPGAGYETVSKDDAVVTAELSMTSLVSESSGPKNGHSTLGQTLGKRPSTKSTRKVTLSDEGCVFVVRSRGGSKDYDEEKLAEIKQLIVELLGESRVMVSFEPLASHNERSVSRVANVPATTWELSEKVEKGIFSWLTSAIGGRTPRASRETMGRPGSASSRVVPLETVQETPATGEAYAKRRDRAARSSKEVLADETAGVSAKDLKVLNERLARIEKQMSMNLTVDEVADMDIQELHDVVHDGSP